MTPEVGIAIAGLVSTGIVSAIGIYFTSRARTASFRDKLYSLQSDMLPDLFQAMAELEALLGVLMLTSAEPDRENAWRATQDKIGTLSRLAARLAVLAPGPLYGAIGEYQGIAVEMFLALGQREKPKRGVIELQGHGARVLTLGRAALGVESLTTETQKFFSRDDVAALAKADPANYIATARKALVEKAAEAKELSDR